MTDHVPPRLTFGINRLLISALLMSLAAPSSSGQIGAATTPASSLPANTPYVATMTFDVASVREAKDLDLNSGFAMSGQFVPRTTMLRVMNWDIRNLLTYAYGVDSYQIVGSPS